MFSAEKVDFSTINGALRAHLSTTNLQQTAQLLRTLEVPELIEQLDSLEPADAATCYRLLTKELARDVFDALALSAQSDLLGSLKGLEIAEVFAKLNASESAQLLEELPAMVAAQLLDELPDSQRDQIATILGYADSSVGRIMTTGFLATTGEQTVAQVMDRITPHLAEAVHPHHIMVVDSESRVLGTLTLGALVAAPQEAVVADLCTNIPSVLTSASASEAAQLAAAERIELLPVVDREQHLLGVLSTTQAFDILRHEPELRKSAGSEIEPLPQLYLAAPLRQLVRSRVIWLLVLALGATLTVQVLSSFEETLESMVVLSLFIPLIVGIGGNTGNQAATTVTRALAMGEVRGRDFGRVLLRELRIGATLGLCLGAIAWAVAGIIFEPKIGLVIGLSLVALCSLAAAVGGVMPLIGKYFKVDPAVFSNPFISTFVDAAGLIVYLSVAVLILG